jgi:hypothetical protein
VILNSTTIVKDVPQQPYISIEQQGESKFFINTSNATALKGWQTSIQDIVKKLKSGVTFFEQFNYNSAYWRLTPLFRKMTAIRSMMKKPQPRQQLP